MHSNEISGRLRTGRLLRFVAVVPVALTFLSGCGVLSGSHGTLTVSGTAGPADAGNSASPTPSAGTTDGGSVGRTPAGSTSSRTTASHSPGGGTSGGGSSTSTKGCAAGGSAIPAGAGTALTADLDGDGRADTLWLADRGSTRLLGVRTASGARFSIAFQDAAPETATAVGGRMADGSAVILLNFTREVKLYAVTGCQIVPSLNVQGAQYTFDEGFTGYGSGAGCPQLGTTTGRQLVGYQVKANPGGTYLVTRTRINLSASGSRASNGVSTVLGRRLPASSPVVLLARSVTCGLSRRALEPQT